ncbi:MAG: hypothetical protein ACJATK_002959 [Paracoccaceae bacterium]
MDAISGRNTIAGKNSDELRPFIIQSSPA